MLIQFQCQREGTLFYYQHQNARYARALVRKCPICGSSRVETTGREYRDVDEAGFIVAGGEVRP